VYRAQTQNAVLLGDQDFTAPGKLAVQALTIIYIEEEGLKRKTMCTFVTRLYLNEAANSDLVEIKKQILQINKVRIISFYYISHFIN
jgi:hypothetical protein